MIHFDDPVTTVGDNYGRHAIHRRASQFAVEAIFEMVDIPCGESCCNDGE